MDRFAMQIDLGYVTHAEEVAVLSAQQARHPVDELEAQVDVNDVLFLKDTVKKVRVSEEIKDYIVKLVSATRVASGVQLGASPRASLALMKTAQALALYDGMEFVTPDHVKELAVPVIAHRLVLGSEARFSGATGDTVVREIVKNIAVPA